MGECLIIFVKNPALGRVKTRLARTMGNTAALEIYHQLLKKTYKITSGLTCRKVVYYSDHSDDDDIWNSGFEKKLQNTGDLGVKMKSAISQELKTSQKVCIIGSDCPQLTPEIISTAFSKLDNHDIVIGPANDGGYYLLGVKKMPPDIFEKIPWSTQKVLPETLNRVDEKGLSYHLLPELVDVDTEEDWRLVSGKIS